MSDLMSEQQNSAALAWLDLSYVLGLMLMKTIVLFQMVTVIYMLNLLLPSILRCIKTTFSLEFS